MAARSPRKTSKKNAAHKPNRTASPLRGSQRLQQVLAAAGAGSRRQCEELILAGRVEVDRRVVTELGTRVDPDREQVRLDGLPLRRPRLVHYAVHKPTGVVSTNRDPSGRPRVIDLLPKSDLRLYPVGRLDLNSEGLILLTNDGGLANRLTHPRYGVEKTYRVLVAGHPDAEVLAQLRRGVRLAEGPARVVLDEGRNRQIRRLLARLGHKVLRLVRIAVGPVRLGNLPPGRYRRLTRREVDALRRAVGRPHGQTKA
jgi:23S rRNA pseudouridine2605 synthase